MGTAPVPDEVFDHFAAGVVAELRQRRRRIVLNWASRVGALPAFRTRPSLDLDGLLNNMPQVIDALLDALGRGTKAEAPCALTQIRDHVVTHAQHRLGLGLAAGDLVQEYDELRQDIEGELAALPASRLAPEAGSELQRRLGALIEAIVATSMHTFDDRPPATA